MLTTIDRIGADYLYEAGLISLLQEGYLVSPRGQKTIELSPVAFELKSPHSNVISSPLRKVSYGFLGAELLWMLMGRDDVEMIKFYNGAIANYSDDGQILRGAYGPRLMPQLRRCYDLLRADPDSRQAVITLWQPGLGPSKDVPCTVMFHFILRSGFLHLQVYMRSNDAWLGFPYDLHNFTCIQILLADLLRVQPGHYYHFAGSWHLYELHYAQAMALTKQVSIEDAPLTPRPDFPEQAGWEYMERELAHCKELEQMMRLAPNHISYVEEEINGCLHPFFQQKMGWMLAKARLKHGL